MNGQLDNLARDLAMPAPAATPWVAVTGAKGGVGKTTIAVNLAILLAKAGYRTLLADLDPGCGDVGVHLRLAARRDLDDAAAGECSAREALVDGPAGISVLLGKSGSNRLVGDAPMTALLDELTVVARDFDVVVADTGAGIGPATMSVAERADVVLGVTTPDAAALTDTYAFTKVLQQSRGELPRVVVNRAASHDEAARAAGRLGAVARKFLGAATEMCAKIARDGLVEASVVEQRPLAMFGRGPAAEDLRALCANVLAEICDTRRRRTQPARRPPRLRPAAL